MKKSYTMKTMTDLYRKDGKVYLFSSRENLKTVNMWNSRWKKDYKDYVVGVTKDDLYQVWGCMEPFDEDCEKSIDFVTPVTYGFMKRCAEIDLYGGEL